MTKQKKNSIFSEPDLENSKLEDSKKRDYRSDTFLGISDDMDVKSEEMAHYAERDALVDRYDEMQEEIERLEKELRKNSSEQYNKAKDELEKNYRKHIRDLKKCIHFQNKIMLKQRNLIIEIHKVTMENTR